jgi:membrane protease YdiL (CAAX protease family)
VRGAEATAQEAKNNYAAAMQQYELSKQQCERPAVPGGGPLTRPDDPAPPPTAVPAGRPPVWPVFLTYGAVLVWLVAANAAVVGLRMGDEGGDALAAALSPGVLVGTVALNAASLAVAARLGSRGERPGVRLRTGPGRLGPAAGTLAVASLLGLSQSADLFFSLLGIREAGALGLLQGAVARMSGPVLGLVLLVGGLLAASAEELFFRGFMQTRLAARWGRWPAIAVTAVAFALMHLDPVHASFALAVGILLGWVTELAGSIRPAIAAHVANNLLSLGQAALLPSVPPGLGAFVVVLAATVAVVAVLARAARRARDGRAGGASARGG